MPLYEYKCQQCHKHTEKIQKFSDPEITVCPHCGGPLERVISAPAFAMKGGGWYADGYGSAKPAAAESSTSDTPAPAAAPAASTAAAPAATPSSPASTPASAASDKK